MLKQSASAEVMLYICIIIVSLIGVMLFFSLPADSLTIGLVYKGF